MGYRAWGIGYRILGIAVVGACYPSGHLQIGNSPIDSDQTSIPHRTSLIFSSRYTPEIFPLIPTVLFNQTTHSTLATRHTYVLIASTRQAGRLAGRCLAGWQAGRCRGTGWPASWPVPGWLVPGRCLAGRCRGTDLWVELLLGPGVAVAAGVALLTVTGVTPLIVQLHVGTGCRSGEGERSKTPPKISRRSPLLAGKPPSVAGRPPLLAGRPPSVAGRPPLLAGRPPSVARRPPSLAHHEQGTPHHKLVDPHH